MSCLMLMRLQRRCFAMVLVFKTTTVEHIEWFNHLEKRSILW
jgi:hypothetical protein